MIGLVLAGGLGRRLGGPKAKLRLGPLRLVDRAVQALRAASLDVFVAGGEFGDWQTGLPYVADLTVRGGPLAALAPALLLDDVFLLACDLPGVDAKLILRLLDAVGPYDACVPISGPREQPLAAAYRAGAAAAAKTLALRGGSMRQLLAALSTRYVKASVPALHNINTKTEFDDWEAGRFETDPHS